MQIILEHRGMKRVPTSSEIFTVLTSVCDLCNFEEKCINLRVVRGNHRGLLRYMGLRVLSDRLYSVKVALGGHNETALCVLSYVGTSSGGKMKGPTLMAALRSGIGTKPLNLTHSPRAEASVQMTGPMSKSESESESSVSEADPTRVDVVSPPAEDTSVATTNEYFLNDPRNMHLLVCALVVRCDKNILYWPSFRIFHDALNDARVPKNPKNMVGLLYRSLLVRGYIAKCANEEGGSNYSITAAAVEFAQQLAPSAVPKTLKVRKKLAIRGISHGEHAVATGG